MMLLFPTDSYGYFFDELLALTGADRGQIERKNFADGERYHRIATDIDNCDVMLVGSTGSNDDTLELFDMACGLVQEGARPLTMVLPYFGYVTMDRAGKPGEVVKAKT